MGLGVEVLERARCDAGALDELFDLVGTQPYDAAHLVSGELARIDEAVQGTKGDT